MSLTFVFAVGLALIGAGFIAYGALRIARAIDVKAWKPVAAVILERRVIEEPVMIEQFHPSYYPAVRYRYESASGPRESGAFSVAPKDYRSFNRLEVDRELADFTEGSRVLAYVCPHDDHRAVLRRTVSRRTMSHYMAVLVSGLLVLTATLLVLAHLWFNAPA